MNIYINDYLKIIYKTPSLTSEGVNTQFFLKKLRPNEDTSKIFESERNLFALKFEEFKICCEWMSKFKKIKTPQMESIYLKNVIHVLSGEYVSNGSVIASAIYLGLIIKYDPNECHYAHIGISKKCPYIKKTKNLVDLLIPSLYLFMV